MCRCGLRQVMNGNSILLHRLRVKVDSPGKAPKVVGIRAILSRTFTSKSRQESGPDYLLCATFARQRNGKGYEDSHQQPEVNYLPRFGPQLISLEE